MKEGCKNKFEQKGGRNRKCSECTPIQKPPKIYDISTRSRKANEPQFQITQNEPYRMYLYLLDRMGNLNLPIKRTQTHKWYKTETKISSN